MKRLIIPLKNGLTKVSSDMHSFWVCSLFFLSRSFSHLSFFWLSRGLEKMFGREGEVWLLAPALPGAPLRKGEGFLPRQPSETFCEQQEPGLLQPASQPAWGFCLHAKKSLTESPPLFLKFSLPLFFYLLLANHGAGFIRSCSYK